MFSGFAGLGSLEQALMFLGRWSCVSFEKDEQMWTMMCQNLSKWASSVNKKQQGLQAKMAKEEKLQQLVAKHMKGEKELSQDEVLDSF